MPSWSSEINIVDGYNTVCGDNIIDTDRLSRAIASLTLVCQRSKLLSRQQPRYGWSKSRQSWIPCSFFVFKLDFSKVKGEIMKSVKYQILGISIIFLKKKYGLIWSYEYKVRAILLKLLD